MPSSQQLVIIYLRSSGAPLPEEEQLGRAAAGLGASMRVIDWQALPDSLAPALQPGDDDAILVGSVAALAALGGPPSGASVVAMADGGDDPRRLAGSEEWLSAVVRRPPAEEDLAEALRRAAAHARLLGELRSLRSRVKAQGQELKELNRIGVALSAERSIDVLLELILSKCRAITSADAGSLYLVERKEGAEPDERDYFRDKELVFRLAQNDSVAVSLSEFRMEISPKSLAGHVVLTGEALSIDDAYAIPPDREYGFNRTFDESSGYRTRSLLVIPMRNHKDEVIGALQLINRKRDREARIDCSGGVDPIVIPFDERSAELASSLASQAAVAIENARLYQEIQTLFEGFIKASVTAIESRDPTTSGHSERVAVLTVGLAEKVDGESSGPLAEVRFSRDDMKEIKYASLLHDFGKIGVREHVLLKGKKLYPHEMEAVERRFSFVRRSLELRNARRKLELYQTMPRDQAGAAAAVLDAELSARLEQLDRYFQLVLEANEPTVLKSEASALLEEISAARIEGVGEELYRLLEPREARNLTIAKGSLSEEERREIESHVTHTYEFLANIPWTRELSQVPRIAWAHHEKLDGSGYPRRIPSGSIPLQSRIMTISDIFDALTARDRPYKRAIPASRAIEILSYEVKEGKVDADLFRIFVEGKVYEAMTPPKGPIRA